MLSAAHSQVPRLEVGAVRARDQLPVSVVAREPGLQVVLLGGGVVQGPRNNADHPVGQPQALVELLRNLDHFLMGSPRVFGLAQDELLDLLELVDPEDPPVVLAVGAGLLPEACAEASVLDREGLLLDPLAPVEARNRLF